jgi:hypothetical protein
MSIANELKLGTLQTIKVKELEISHPIGLVYKAGRYLSSAMQQFLSDLKGMPESHFVGSE